jgi:hypothetical protein
MSHRVRIIRAGELVKAYLGIVAAMAAALIPRAAGLLPLILFLDPLSSPLFPSRTPR